MWKTVKMEPITKLEQKNITRKLWQEIFTEDTEEFLDYYYREKTKDNQILAIKENGEIVSMLHMNPYELSVFGEKVFSYYIVAVATKQEYRHQGKMAKLLIHAMKQAAEEKKPFIFLMPAKESIYLPFQFVTVYERKDYIFPTQKRQQNYLWEIQVEKLSERSENKESLVKEVVEYSGTVLRGRYELYAIHSKAYYLRLLKEQASQQGYMLLFRNKETGRLCGYSFLTKEGNVEFRELVCDQEKEAEIVEWMQAHYKEQETIEIAGADFFRLKKQPDKIFPCIMVRVTDLLALHGLLPLQKAQTEEFRHSKYVYIKDKLLPENEGLYRFYVVEKQQKSFLGIEKTGKTVEVYETNSIEEFTKNFFKNCKIFLNEVV